MRKKLFTFLLALVAATGFSWAETTVTWNSSNVSDLYVAGTGSYSKEGVTLSGNSGNVIATWDDGIAFYTYGADGYTFSNTLGKNFTKIEMFPISSGWAGVNLGDWSFSGENGDPVTWEGNASTVDLLKGVSGFNDEKVNRIVFYFEGDSEEPTTPTVYTSGSVALSNLNVGDILMAGVTVTSEKADYKITLVANRLKFMNSVRSTDLTTQFSSINPVLGENAVILTSTAAMFYTPIDEDGNIGNAWEVTANEVGTKVTLAGITYSGTTPASSDEGSGSTGALPGKFSVSASQVVYFSQGNLQATTADNGSTWTWGFAEHQYDFIGDAVANNAINGGGTVSSNGAVDLFGWSSDDNNYFGIDNSTNLTDYDGNFQDWGTKMGSDWRTLTYDEWNYLLNTRVPGSSAASTSNPRFARAQIFTDGTAPSKDIYGLILFPDDFNDGGSIDGVTWNGINSYDAVSPTYCTTAGWATLESMGCVFLPASGYRSDGAVTNVGAFGIYWASTKSTETDEDASCMYFFSNNVAVFRSYFKTGASVRLVSETAPGGSTPATGLQVVEVTSDIYNGWNSNGNTFSVNALPGFQAVTFDEAKAWTEVPTSGTAVLVYRTNGDYARVIHFFDGTISGDYDLETDFNQMYENITLFGNRIFYTTGGGSTPTPTTSGSCGANVTWEFNPSTGALTITGTGAMDDYLNNASTPWNSYIADITSVTITDGVTNVGNHSFEQCTSLTTVTIGDDVETIGVFAFSECGEQFTTLTLGNSIRTIGNQAFASNYGITGFTLPSTLETIGNFAFIHNKAITTLTIPSNVTSIDQDAFYGCTAVTDVYCYPNAADLTWNEVDCDDFKSGKATICHVNSDQLDAYQTKFNDVVRVTFVGDLDAPASNPHGECGAQGDNLLWELDPSTGVLTITGSGAMYDWPNNPETPWYDNIYQITSVVLPSGITTIGDFAFKGCTNLASINMTENYPAGLTAIKQQAFCHTALTSITIPESVVTIGMDAFRLSTDIENVYCYADPNNLTWNDYYCDDFKNADHATVCHVKACALSTYEAKWGGTPYNVFNSTGVNVTFVGDLPGDCPAPTPTGEQVPTNADPENPSYHYSTFFHSTQNYKLSNDGTQAFIADLSNNELVLTEIAHGEQVIPANTAVILRKAGSADPVVLVPTEENGVSVNPDDNSLEGVDVATPVADIAGLTVDNCYVLSGTVQYGVGFYKINGNTLKAHKAYVKFTGGPNNAPKKMRFVFNQEQTATGVESIQSSAISGQKLIENGQLIIIKNGVRYNAQGQIVK